MENVPWQRGGRVAVVVGDMWWDCCRDESGGHPAVNHLVAVAYTASQGPS